MSEARQYYNVMFDNMVQGAFFQNADGSLLDVNTAALTMFGLTRDQFLGRTSYHPDWHVIDETGAVLSPEQHPSMVALKSGQPVKDFTLAVYNPRQKSYTWLQVNAIPLFIEKGEKPDQVLVTIDDISEKKRLENIRNARQKLLEFSVDHSLDDLLVETLNALEELTQSSIGFYHFYDESQQDITLKAWSTRTSQEFCHVEGLKTHYPLKQAGIWTDCVKTRKPAVHNDYPSEPQRKGLPEGHAPVVRELIVPVLRQDRIVAILGIGNKPSDYVESDIETTSMFADLAWDIAEVKLKEERLEKSEKQYRDLFEHLQVGFALHEILTDQDGEPIDYRFKAVNPAFETLTGLNASNVVGRKISDIIPSIEQRWIAIYGKVALTGQPVDFEEYTSSMDKYFQVHAYSPEPGIFATLFYDITSRKKDETAIRESQKRLMLVADHAPVLIAQVDRNLVYKFVNRRYAEFFGAEPREYIGRNARDFLAQDYLTNLQPYLETALNGELVNFDTNGTNQEGQTVTFQTTYAPEFDESGQVIGLIAAIVDITARKKAEAELLRNQYFLTRGQEIGKIGSWEIDIATQTAFNSDEQCRIFGEPPGTPIDFETFKSKLHPEDQARVIQSWLDAIQGADYEVEHRIVIDGQVRWVRSKADISFDESGQALKAVGFTQDITEQKEQERQRLQLESELLHSRKMEALGTMASGMAHNFNNNLAIIMGNLELAQRKTADVPGIDRHLQNAKTALLRSRDLISQIMVYTRQDTLNKMPLQTVELVAETHNLLRSTLPTSVEFRVELPPPTPNTVILANSSRIQEALINLCTNAVHAMNDKGCLTIRLESRNLKITDLPQPQILQPGQYVVIQVTDTGSGIPDEVREKIFDPFFTTKGVGVGTGMGLATVRAIVETHDGFINVDSQVSQGTSFELIFPVCAEEARQSLIESKPVGGSETILLVDDEEALASLEQEILETLGYQVTSVTEPLMALNLIKEDPDRFDLVLTDQTMPGLTGADLAQQVKEIRPDLPVILCTGYSQHVSKKTAQQYGIEAYCMKPLQINELSRTLRECLDRNNEKSRS